MRKRNNFTRLLLLLRRMNLLCKKTHPRYSLRLRVVTVDYGYGEITPCLGVNNADRRRNFTNFNRNLADRFVDAKSEI